MKAGSKIQWIILLTKLTEYIKNKDTFVKNYDLMKGILKAEDFYQEPEVKSFTEILEKDLELPKYVKHYSIMTTPINELVGEISKRPDTYRVKAFDDNSRSEELQFKTDILQEYVLNEAKNQIFAKAARQGMEIPDDELQKMAFEEVKDQLDSYTSVAEKWGNHTLNSCKTEFNIKEKRKIHSEILIYHPGSLFIYMRITQKQDLTYKWKPKKCMASYNS